MPPPFKQGRFEDLPEYPTRPHVFAEAVSSHVEVQAEWDVFLLLAATPTDVATMPEPALVDLHAGLVRQLVADSRLEADGRALPLRVTGALPPVVGPNLGFLIPGLTMAGTVQSDSCCW